MNISQVQADSLKKQLGAGLTALHRPRPVTAVEWMNEHYYLPVESSYQEGRWETLPFQVARETAGDRPIPGWLQVVGERQRILVHQLPTREQIQVPLTEQLIVEFYSK